MRVGTGERRRHERIPYHEPVSLSWQDAVGRTHISHGKCVDRSQEGLQVEVRDPIELRAIIQVQLGRSCPAGLARVRHCARKGLHFVVGLEFTRGFRWENLSADMVA